MLGQGRAAVSLDRAVASVTVWARRRRVAEAFAEVAAGVARVEALAAEVDVRVVSQSLQTYPGHDERGLPDGFECHHGLRLAASGVETASDLLGRVVEDLGAAVRIDAVDLVTADPGAAKVSAREAAYADAHATAHQLAELSGSRLGEALMIEVVGSGGPAPVAGLTRTLKAEADAGLVAGEHDVEVTLRVSFALA